MSFFFRQGWQVQFLEADLKTPLPRHLTFTDADKIRELARKGEAWGDSESRQMLEGGRHQSSDYRAVHESSLPSAAVCETLFAAMTLYRRGNIWWFNFRHDGRHIQRSTSLTNKNDARQIEAAFHMALIKGGVGIADRKKMPGFRTAMSDFLNWSEHAHQESSHRRYRVSSVALLHFFKDASLTDVTADEIERFKTARIQAIHDGQSSR